MSATVSFRQMKDGTAADYRLIDQLYRQYVRSLPDRITEALAKLKGSSFGYQIDRYTHSLQTATRALRAGADEEMVTAALVHDIGDELAPYNHASLAASVLRPYVRPEVTWIVEQHGLFQTYYYVHHMGGDRNQRDRLRGHPWFDACAAFCEEWDQPSFDPDYDNEPLATFEPIVRRIFTRTAHDPLNVRV